MRHGLTYVMLVAKSLTIECFLCTNAWHIVTSTVNPKSGQCLTPLMLNIALVLQNYVWNFNYNTFNLLIMAFILKGTLPISSPCPPDLEQ